VRPAALPGRRVLRPAPRKQACGANGSTVENIDRNRFSLSAGAQLQTDGGFSARLEVQSVLGNGGDSDHGIMLNTEKSD
jgi:hypothetical protein